MNEEPINQLSVMKTETPVQLMRLATDVAGVSREIVMKTALTIQGRKYVRVEGWQAIALAHGCVAGSRNVEKIEGGYRAIGEVKRMSDGMILSTAEGFVGMDETKTWGQRPEYACRAMAQTRAISRACRSAFAHVVVLIDSNLSTTPAEEVPPDGFEGAKPVHATQSPPPEPKPSPKPAKAQEPASGEPLSEGTGLTLKSVKIINSKPDAAKPWTLYVGLFVLGADEREISSFDKKLGESMQDFENQVVDIKYKAGRKAGTFELVQIMECDPVPF